MIIPVCLRRPCSLNVNASQQCQQHQKATCDAISVSQSGINYNTRQHSSHPKTLSDTTKGCNAAKGPDARTHLDAERVSRAGVLLSATTTWLLLLPLSLSLPLPLVTPSAAIVESWSSAVGAAAANAATAAAAAMRGSRSAVVWCIPCCCWSGRVCHGTAPL